MPYFFWCAHCSKQSTDEHHCSYCGLERKDKLFPLWQRAMRDPATDTRKYQEPGSGESGWAKKMRKARKRKEDLDW